MGGSSSLYAQLSCPRAFLEGMATCGVLVAYGVRNMAGKEQQTGDGSVWSGDGTHECVRVSVCAWVCSCTHLYIQACMDVYIHVCVHRGMCEYEGVCTGLCGCTWMWMCACARVPVGAM